MTRLCLTVAAVLTAAPAFRAASLELVTREAYLMGTRATLATLAPSRAGGLQTLETALAELEQTDRELSTWREASDISALNRRAVGSPWAVPPHLCRMFAQVWHWYRLTGGAFDPGIGHLLAAWDVHGAGAIPTDTARAAARASSGLSRLAFDPAACTVTRTEHVRLDVGAFGKGEALDRVAAALGNRPWMIDLGGQVSVGGEWPEGWPIAIAHPADRNRSVVEARLYGGSLSTSGGSERDLRVGGRRIAHVLDPRSGRPATFDGSVTVWHPQGLAADALSTALFVMGLDEGRRWAEAHGIAALFLSPVDDTVRVHATAALQRESRVRLTGRE